jgi:hypothetical protein
MRWSNPIPAASWSSQIDFSKIDDPNFSQEMVAQLDDAVARGAHGLKQLKDLGLTVRDRSGKE